MQRIPENTLSLILGAHTHSLPALDSPNLVSTLPPKNLEKITFLVERGAVHFHVCWWEDSGHYQQLTYPMWRTHTLPSHCGN